MRTHHSFTLYVHCLTCLVHRISIRQVLGPSNDGLKNSALSAYKEYENKEYKFECLFNFSS